MLPRPPLPLCLIDFALDSNCRVKQVVWGNVSRLRENPSPLPPQLHENLPDLSSRIHILLISTTGVLYQPISASLSLLGISNADASRLLRSLNIHSVRCAMSILKARRQLEHDPLTFANHPRYTEPLRPPPPVDPP